MSNWYMRPKLPLFFRVGQEASRSVRQRFLSRFTMSIVTSSQFVIYVDFHALLNRGRRKCTNLFFLYFFRWWMELFASGQLVLPFNGDSVGNVTWSNVKRQASRDWLFGWLAIEEKVKASRKVSFEYCFTKYDDILIHESFATGLSISNIWNYHSM